MVLQIQDVVQTEMSGDSENRNMIMPAWFPCSISLDKPQISNGLDAATARGWHAFEQEYVLTSLTAYPLLKCD